NGTPQTTTNTGNNTITASVILQKNADGTVAKTATGTETGSNTSTNPAVGTTTTNNQPMDGDSLQQFVDDVQLLQKPRTGANADGAGGEGRAPADDPPQVTLRVQKNNLARESANQIQSAGTTSSQSGGNRRAWVLEDAQNMIKLAESKLQDPTL